MGRRHYSDEEKNAIMSRYAAGAVKTKQCELFESTELPNRLQ